VYAAQFLYASAKVWRVLEVLLELIRRGLVERGEVYRYESAQVPREGFGEAGVL